MRTVAEKPRPFPRGIWKLVAFGLVVTLALAALVARLTQIQVFEGARFAAAARANQIRRIPVAAPRGRIYDRNGVVLVRSRPSFVCAMIPSDVDDIAATMSQLASVLGIPQSRLWKRLLHHRGITYKNFDEVATYEPYGPVVLASDLSSTQMARLAEAQDRLPGLDLEAQPVRDYPYHKLGSHVFGYVGAITEDEYRTLKGRGYTPNDVIGKEGLEEQYDRYLRGIPGGQQIVVNAAGQLVRRLGPIDPTPGSSLVLSIDWRIQAIAETALREQLAATSKLRGRRLAGAVVAIDPRDGGIVALASYPNFDPNDFTNGIKESTFARYLNDPLRPLYDRAIAAATPTGSTFKMVTGSGAISSGVIGKHQVLYDSGAWNCHGHTFVDIASGGLGTTNFEHALAASSDGYFYQLGYRLGHERLRYWALEYGLGSKLGVDVPGEYPGNWPTNAWSMKVYGLPLEPSDVCQLAIGQGAMQATPLQMADIAATVVNGGTLFRPHLVAAIRDTHGRIVKRFDREIIRRVPVTQEALREVRTGMDQVTQPWGTAYGEDVPGVPYGGKTGTAETDGGNGPKYDLVRRLRTLAISQDRNRRFHGALGRLRREHGRPRRAPHHRRLFSQEAARVNAKDAP
ncbi:MAG: penicillin-binding protein 2 [Candidatus Eremiobacteraeota bacterium]|nr:penicillin-binding protein 2 [Candidatus Eremiobacteraeota bacterium]